MSGPLQSSSRKAIRKLFTQDLIADADDKRDWRVQLRVQAEQIMTFQMWCEIWCLDSFASNEVSRTSNIDKRVYAAS